MAAGDTGGTTDLDAAVEQALAADEDEQAEGDDAAGDTDEQAESDDDAAGDKETSD